MKIGIDLGGSHIAIGVVSNNINIIEKYEIDINTQNNIKQFIEKEIITNTKQLIKKYNIEEIGIAVPGVVKDQKILGLYNLGIGKYNIISSIAKEINIPIKIKNDGVCAAIAEMKFGNLQPYNKSVFVCLGTGIGGAICENGISIPSNEKIGYEFGHMPFEKAGEVLQEKCKCGKNDCFELYGSIKRLKNSLLNEILQNNNNNNNLSGKEIHDLILENINNKNVNKILEKYIQNTAYGIYKIACITKPQAICLGGGFTYYKDILLNRFVKEFYKLDINAPKIVVAKFENDAGIIGAAN